MYTYEYTCIYMYVYTYAYMYICEILYCNYTCYRATSNQSRRQPSQGQPFLQATSLNL